MSRIVSRCFQEVCVHFVDGIEVCIKFRTVTAWGPGKQGCADVIFVHLFDAKQDQRSVHCFGDVQAKGEHSYSWNFWDAHQKIDSRGDRSLGVVEPLDHVAFDGKNLVRMIAAKVRDQGVVGRNGRSGAAGICDHSFDEDFATINLHGQLRYMTNTEVREMRVFLGRAST